MRFVEHLAFKKGERRGWIASNNSQELIGAKEKGVTFGWWTSPHMHKPYNQISICERKLFVCFVCHIEISQTMVPLIMLLVWLESPWLVRVHWGGLLMLRTTMQELSIIEFFSKKFNKMKIKYFRKIEVSTCYYWKAFDGWDS